MAEKSTIEWTDSTWNPVRGCTEISPGCAHCYARSFSERFRGVPGHPFEQGFSLRLVPEKLAEPLRWPTRRRVFVNSMSDLFHDDVPDAFIREVANTMKLASWHTFQVLTKRPARMLRLFDSVLRDLVDEPNIWWGVSVENQKHGLPRIDLLRTLPVRCRFLSIEPLLEDLGTFNLGQIDWVIVGGESGRGARPIEIGWVRSIRDQCQEANVPFFFKQWGGERKHITGRRLDGRLHNSIPRMTRSSVPDRSVRRALQESLSRDSRYVC
jgi:protein gp37